MNISRKLPWIFVISFTDPQLAAEPLIQGMVVNLLLLLSRIDIEMNDLDLYLNDRLVNHSVKSYIDPSYERQS